MPASTQRHVWTAAARDQLREYNMYLVGSVTLITCQYWTGFPDGHNAFASVLSETELEVQQREANNNHHNTVRDEKGTCKDTTLCDVIYNIHSYMQQVIICCRSLTKKLTA